jgi:iron complex outermembrane receptor protein
MKGTARGGRLASTAFSQARFRLLVSGLAIGCTFSAAAPAFAQEASAAPATQQAQQAEIAPGEIIVTARKRQETQLDVPVIENVVTAQTLERQQVLTLEDLTKLTPGLMIGTAVLSIGQQVTLRGIGTSSFDPGIDQSVSLNIDGLALGQGLAFGSGMFDVDQVEVLKGPQSLFYGKSSTGGVIAIHTADPTDRFEVKGSAAYEAEAHTKRFEGVISGPITSTLKARIAGFFQQSDGYYYNGTVVPSDATFSPAPGVSVPVSATGGVTPRYDRLNRTQNYMVRGTLLWEPSDRFDAKLKVNYVHDRAFNAETGELKYCPDGIGGIPAFGNSPFINPADTCTLDRTGYTTDLNPANFVGLSSGSSPVTSVVESRQIYGTLEMNYKLNDNLTATSVSGYYDLRSHSVFNTSFAAYAGPLLAVTNPAFRRHDFTEEIRINSDLPGPFNFTLGGFYQTGHVSDRVTLYANNYFIPAGSTGIPLQDGLNRFSIRTYSAFGQARYKIVPQVEIAAGVRVTSETRRQNPYLFTSLTTLGQIASGALPASYAGGFAPAIPSPSIDSVRTSPEATITWKPTENLNIFGSYKIAYKSGSFSIATPPTLESTSGTPVWLDNSFGDEKVSGFEAGIKGRLFNRQLNFTLAGFDYKYVGLQVGGIEPSVGTLPVIRTVNAGAGRSKGIEFEAHLTPRYAIPGLTLNGAVNYTHARFSVLNNIPCYGGQTIAQGCNQQFDPGTGLFFAQDLSGAPFLRAPDWNGNFGFEYEIPLPHAWKLIVSNNNYYTTKFLTTPDIGSEFYQKGYIKFDASLTLQGKDDRWEVSLIGKNLSREYTGTNCSPSNFQNGLLGGEITGGTGRGPAGRDEVLCYMDPGRELWVRLTIRPFG